MNNSNNKTTNHSYVPVSSLRDFAMSGVTASTTFTEYHQIHLDNFFNNEGQLLKGKTRDLVNESLEHIHQTMERIMQARHPKTKEWVERNIVPLKIDLLNIDANHAHNVRQRANDYLNKALESAKNAKAAGWAGTAVTAADLAVQTNEAIKTGDWSEVGRSLAGLGGAYLGSKLGVISAIGIAAAIGLSAPATAIVVGIGATAGVFIGDYFGKWTYDNMPDLLPDSLAKLIQDWTGLNRVGRHYFVSDPLILDLDGDGIETVAHQGSRGAMFDLDADGIANGTGWVKSDDGILVLDRNGDGMINDGRELFGDSVILADGRVVNDQFFLMLS